MCTCSSAQRLGSGCVGGGVDGVDNRQCPPRRQYAFCCGKIGDKKRAVSYLVCTSMSTTALCRNKSSEDRVDDDGQEEEEEEEGASIKSSVALRMRTTMRGEGRTNRVANNNHPSYSFVHITVVVDAGEGADKKEPTQDKKRIVTWEW